MLEVFFIGLVIAFVIGLNIGVLFLLFFNGPRLLKYFPWMRSLPWIQRDPTLDWADHPLRSFLALSSGFLTLALCGIAWPVILVGIFRGREREKEELILERRAEFQTLLQEIQEDREGSFPPSPDH